MSIRQNYKKIYGPNYLEKTFQPHRKGEEAPDWE